MKGKIVLLATVIAIFTLTTASMVKAFPNLSLYGYTDKVQYKPGEKGTVKFWIYNWGPDDVIIKNVTIEYPWYSPIWGGNQTIQNIDYALSKSKNYSNTDSFTIPDDGRALTGDIAFTAYYSYGGSDYPEHSSVSINVVPNSNSPGGYIAFQDMDKIVTLFTVLVVLVIVCTVIIAATIFLSARKPPAMFPREKPPQ